MGNIDDLCRELEINIWNKDFSLLGLDYQLNSIFLAIIYMSEVLSYFILPKISN